MILLLPSRIGEKIVEALRIGGSREVGGILMGEHVGVNRFRVADLTSQAKGGTFARFVRFADAIVQPLRTFFQAKNHEYTRFNYLGEWHSHPSFSLEPSATDNQSMLDIVRDSSVGARFAVLLLVKLDSEGVLQSRVFVYERGKVPYIGTVEDEE